MNYKEKKRSMFLGLPWTFTSYTITDEIITVDSGLLRKEENDCYLYKVIDVRLECTLMERIFGLGAVHCFTGDYILRQSEQERLKRKTLNMQHLDGNPSLGEMADTDSCK